MHPLERERERACRNASFSQLPNPNACKNPTQIPETVKTQAFICKKSIFNGLKTSPFTPISSLWISKSPLWSSFLPFSSYFTSYRMFLLIFSYRSASDLKFLWMVDCPCMPFPAWLVFEVNLGLVDGFFACLYPILSFRWFLDFFSHFNVLGWFGEWNWDMMYGFGSWNFKPYGFVSEFVGLRFKNV